MAVYDPTILQKFADNLYSRADKLVAKYTTFGILLGLALALATKSIFMRNVPGNSANFMAMLILFVCIVGFYTLGAEKAFALRLEAQRTLCQLQLEKNTRNLVPPGA